MHPGPGTVQRARAAARVVPPPMTGAASDPRQAARRGGAAVRRARHRQRVDRRDRAPRRPAQLVGVALSLRKPRRRAGRAARAPHPRHPPPATRTARRARSPDPTTTPARRRRRSSGPSPSSRSWAGVSARTCNTEASSGNSSTGSPPRSARCCKRPPATRRGISCAPAARGWPRRSGSSGWRSARRSSAGPPRIAPPSSIAVGEHPVLSDDLFVDNLVDMVVGAMTATATVRSRSR